MSGCLVVIGGGVRSGKSAFALRLAEKSTKRRIYVATAEARDEEMRERITRHRHERGGKWTTIEEPLEIPDVLGERGEETVILLDCLTLWLSNQLLAGQSDEQTLARVDELISVQRRRGFDLIVVTNEVGMGIVPESALGRRFRDLAGWAHQRLGKAADEVYFAALGQILRLKPSPLAVATDGDAA